MQLRPKFAVAATALALAATGLAACGDDENETTASPPATSTQADGMASGSKAGEKNVVALAQETPALSTLVDAVTAADLVETLQGDGPFTVFAPTNDAFAELGDTLDTLLEPVNKQQLAGVLTYHVVPGELKAADLEDGQRLETVNGERLRVRIKGDAVTVGGAAVATPDVDASNGVVHVIDGVLQPSA